MNLAPIFMLQSFSQAFFDPTFTSLPEHKKDVEIKLEKIQTAVSVYFQLKIIRFPSFDDLRLVIHLS